jgi:transcriptional regulator with XRE-family HTH domain
MGMNTESSFARRLRELRETVGLTQHQLAERAGMHRQGIAKLENGEREPTWATVRTLAKALGVTCMAFESEGEERTEEPPKPRGRPRKADTSTEAPPENDAEVVKPAPEKTRKRKGNK